MSKVRMVTLGSTGITVPQNAFGALPIQRVKKEEDALHLLRRAFEGGMRLFDTARAYGNSEGLIGKALHDVREEIVIESKTMATDPESFWNDLKTSLEQLQTDHIDIYQFHCAAQCYRPDDGTGMYECMMEAKSRGMIRHIGISAHKIGVAIEAVESGLYEVLEFPFSYIAGQKEIDLVRLCREKQVGFICMKALAGGLLMNAKAAMAYLSQYDNVVPIWGIQKAEELEEFLSFMEKAPELTDELQSVIDADRAELGGDFCRSCGYCMPCPVGIQIYQCARMSQLIRRMPTERWTTPYWQEEMKRIEDCLHCNSCSSKCPYELDTPTLLRKNYEDYQKVIAGEIEV